MVHEIEFQINNKHSKQFYSLWEEVGLGVSETMVNELTHDIVHPLHNIRLAASMGLSTAISEKTDLSAQIVTVLLEIYEDKVKVFENK